MHEVHLVRAIVDTVEKQARAQHAKRVKSLKIRFNALTSHGADHVQFSFDVVKKEHPLIQEAILELHEVDPTLACTSCRHTFRGKHLPEVCPKCGSLEVKPVNSIDMVLESFEIEK